MCICFCIERKVLYWGLRILCIWPVQSYNNMFRHIIMMMNSDFLLRRLYYCCCCCILLAKHHVPSVLPFFPYHARPFYSCLYLYMTRGSFVCSNINLQPPPQMIRTSTYEWVAGSDHMQRHNIIWSHKLFIQEGPRRNSWSSGCVPFPCFSLLSTKYASSSLFA